MTRIRIIRSAEDLAALQPQWWDLWRRAAAPPFLSPAWLLPWWQVFHPGELRSVAVLDGGRLMAFAALYCDRGRLLPVGIALSDYLDVLADPHDARALPALAEGAHDVRDWAEWSLEELPPEATALALPAPRGCSDGARAQSACPVLALPPAPDRLGAAIPAAKRRKLRMARHRADRRGGFAVERVEADGVGGFLRELTRLHQARWAEKGGSEALRGGLVEEFLAAATPRLVAEGLGRLFLLRLAGHCAGAYYGMSDGLQAYAWLGGFDADFARESPGTLLIAHAIEAASAEGCREFHFLRGREPYKYEWGAVDRWSVRRVLSRETPHA
ncbi:MAG TPA: GNAT family N-acetyltransferase [Steroidobacteraceae bacterium]|nr:GNAT family N-acetyltransferase [Steroidobacteraceae bacterium]